MKFISTRGKGEFISSSEAIIKGIADDGGLYVPVEFPRLYDNLKKKMGLSYEELAYEIIRKFFDDIGDESLKGVIREAYSGKFFVREEKGFLELYHGPTSAFKDAALLFLPQIMKAAKKKENITIVPKTTMIDFIEKDNVCQGIVCEDEYGEMGSILARDIILATGGLGGLFLNSTNYPHITGDSFALAIKHGVELKDINYIQIHPTTLYSKKKGRRFLISESVRGEGAILLNENGERFTDELQPRDVVTNAIVEEMKKFGTDHVYITLPTMTTEQAAKRFPNIFDACMEEGYDITKDKVPVTPAQHYMMGGIKTDLYGRTSMAHLYAAGETACNGVHGKNRLASNSLLESLVFAKRAADVIADDKSEKPENYNEIDLSSYPPKEERQKEFKKLIMDEIKEKDKDFYDKWCNTQG